MTTIFQTATRAAQADGREFLLIGGHAVNARGYERTTLDFDSPEFQEILNRYAIPSIKERLLSDLRRPV